MEDELTKKTIYSDISLVNYNFSSDLKFCLKNESSVNVKFLVYKVIRKWIDKWLNWWKMNKMINNFMKKWKFY